MAAAAAVPGVAAAARPGMGQAAVQPAAAAAPPQGNNQQIFQTFLSTFLTLSLYACENDLFHDFSLKLFFKLNFS